MAQDFLLEMRTNYNQFTKTTKKVADYILANSEKVIYMSITDLAEACKVGDASVYRFCRGMGLGGYQELKMRLSLSMSEADLFSGEDPADAEEEGIDFQDGVGKMAQEIMHLYMDGFQSTYKLLSSKTIESVSAMMKRADRIFFSGIGDSLQVAVYARNRFLRITNKAYCITDPHIQVMTAAMMNKNDLIVVFSHSGATKDNIEVAEAAKAVGAAVVVITRYVKSPLTAFADAVLLCGADENPLQGGSMTVRMNQLFMLDILYHQYARENQEESQKNKRITAKAVVEKLF